MTRRRPRVVLATAAALAVVSATAACGPAESGDGAGQRTLTVSAAASLTEPFTQLARRFQADHPRVRVSLNFGGSAQLAEQIVSGAPVDVFASASRATMDQVVSAGRAHGTPTVFAGNVLQIAVPPGNPGRVHGLGDFGRAEPRLAVCLPTVPCGAAAKQLFTLAGVDARPDTYEDDVKAVLTKVELGEADAGLVYRTDVRSAGAKVEGIDLPLAGRVVNDYPIVAVSGSSDASQFIAFVLSDAGRTAMSQAGFLRP